MRVELSSGSQNELVAGSESSLGSQGENICRILELEEIGRVQIIAMEAKGFFFAYGALNLADFGLDGASTLHDI